MSSPIGNSIRVAALSSVALTNARTAITALAAVPILEVVLLVAVSASVGNRSLVLAAYAAALLGLGTAIVAGIVTLVARDRFAKVLYETLLLRPFSVVYWVGKIAIPAFTALIVTFALIFAIAAVDGFAHLDLLGRTLMLVPLVLMSAILLGLAVCLLSLALSDPYTILNALVALLPLTAGVIAPLSMYPPVLAGLSSMLPFTHAIALLGKDNSGSGVLVEVILELTTSAVWLVVGVLCTRWALRRIYQGRVAQEMF